MGGGGRRHATTVPATPPPFRLRLRLRTALELERERLGRMDWQPHFRDREYRLLWGNELVTQDFSAAPRDLRPTGVTASSGGVSISIPRAYYGQVGGDGVVSRDDIVETGSGFTTLEIGEYRDRLPNGMSPELWALDQRAARRHFHPLVQIPLGRVDPPVDAAASRPVEIWWRLWNLGQVTDELTPAHPAAGADASATRPFSRSNDLAKVRWNGVRRVFGSSEISRDEAFLADLIRYHEGEEP